MADLITMLSAVAGQQGEEVDDDFNQTVLLLHGDGTNGAQNNTFLDSSTNNFTITRNGNVTQGSFGPFSRSSGNLVGAPYDPAVHGGSGYFDGSGDYLDAGNQTAYNFDGQFTVEAWVYRTVGSTNQAIAGKWALNNEAWLLLIGSGNTIIFYYEASNITTTATIPLNAWCHIAVTRDSSNDIRIFVDGVQTGSTTNSSVNITSTSSLTIGAYNSTGSITAYLTGYIAGLRVLKGTAQYTSNFTPPTSPPTAVTNTQLLCNFTNAGIIDNTGKNNLGTVGDAQIDTTTKKYGTGSMEFDGTGDWLLMPNTPDQQLGTGNFTIEFWVYLATGDTGSARGLVAKGTSTTGFLVSLDSSQKVVFTYTTSTITSSGAITLDAWNHIAVVREGTGSNQTKIYIGGTNDGTGTVSTDFNQTSVMYVGANRTGGDSMKGFIDDLRITKGIARYTANFSVPGKAFPDL